MIIFARIIALVAAVTGASVLFIIPPESTVQTGIVRSRLEYDPLPLRPHSKSTLEFKKDETPLLALSQYKSSIRPSDIGFRNELPFEYLGAEVLSAEELTYENGVTELLCIMDVGLGQEKILLVEKSHASDRLRYSTAYSAERFNILPRPEYHSNIKAALQHLGLQVFENKYGAPTLSISIPEASTNFFRIKSLVENLLQNRGELILSAPLGSTTH